MNNEQHDDQNDNDEAMILGRLEYLTGRDVSDEELNQRSDEGWLVERLQFMPGMAGGEERLCVVWVREIDGDADDAAPQPGPQPQIEIVESDGERADGETLEGFRTLWLEDAVSDDDLTDDGEDERDVDESAYPAAPPVMNGWVFGHDAPPVGARR